MKEIHLERGDVLFHKGESAFSFYVVKSGALEIRDEAETVQRVAAGSYFGASELLDDGSWHHDAVAIEACSLVSIPVNVFNELTSGIGSLGNLFQKSATKYQSREIVESIGGRSRRKLPRNQSRD